MGNDVFLNLLAIFLLLLANALFTATEFALVRCRRTRMEELLAEGVTSAKAVRDAIDHINDYISAAQVGITAASLALGAIGEHFLAGFVHGVLSYIWAEPSAAVAHGIAVAATVCALLMLTALHVVLGEQLPKVIALRFPEKAALYLIHPVRWFTRVFWPVVWVLNQATLRVAQAMGLKNVPAHASAVSEEELLLMVSESRKAGLLTDDQHRMLHRVLKFHNKTVRQIMVPRPDIVALDLRASVEQIHAVFRQGYSRLPVYDTSLSNVKGIVYMKDLIYTLQDPKLIKLVDLVRETVYVPESKLVAELLREMQRIHMHMAIVVDEFGDTAGLVTMEDIIEEIVGEIQDEYDQESAAVEKGADGSVSFDGKADIERFRENFPDYEMPEGTFDTVAGLVMQIAGHVPKEADLLHHSGLTFKIVQRVGRRLRRIAVAREKLPAPAPTPAPSMGDSPPSVP